MMLTFKRIDFRARSTLCLINLGVAIQETWDVSLEEPASSVSIIYNYKFTNAIVIIIYAHMYAKLGKSRTHAKF